MFAIKLFGANDVRLVECEIPKIEEEEILVKTCVALQFADQIFV